MSTRRVRAKFYISGLTLYPGQNAGGEVKLTAVSRGDRNKDWAAATPSGEMRMTVNNPAGFAWFEEMMETSRRTGKQPEVFIDISHSTDGWPGDGHKFRPAEAKEGEYLYGVCGECGQALDACEWDQETRKPDPARPVHPNG